MGIIIGDNTRAQVADLATIELDLLTVKGKTEPERIHGLLGDGEMSQSSPFLALVEQQAALLRYYRAGAFAEALKVIDGCQAAAAAAGWQQGYYAMMRARIVGLIGDSPLDWTGVYVAKEK